MNFMEPECSLHCLQEPATSPYTDPDESSPCLLFFFLKSALILSSHLRLGSKRSLSIRVFPPKPRPTWFDHSNQISSHRVIKFGGVAGVRQECSLATAIYGGDKSLLFELFCTGTGQSWDMELVVGFASVGFGSAGKKLSAGPGFWC